MNAMLAVSIVSFVLGDVPVTVKMKDGETVRGTLTPPTIRLKTSFGEATFLSEKIASITFGTPDVVITRDQIKLEGTIELESLEVNLELMFEPCNKTIAVMLFSGSID